MAKLAILLLIASLSVTYSMNIAFGANSAGRVNWLEICTNPIVDAVVVEPCRTLTSSDGYTLTKEGERVAACVVGGGLLLLADPTGQAFAQANALASSTGFCRPATAPLAEATRSNDAFSNLLGGLFGSK